MPTTTLDRGATYRPPTQCPWCGECRAEYLAKIRPTRTEDRAQVARYVFQCKGCHATRVIELRANHEGGEPAGAQS